MSQNKTQTTSDEILAKLAPIFKICDLYPKTGEDVSSLGDDLYILRQPYEKGHTLKAWAKHVRKCLDEIGCVYQILDSDFARPKPNKKLWVWCSVKIIFLEEN